MRPARLTWTIGGIGLVLCAVLGMLQYSVIGIGPVVAFDVATDVVFALAVLVFTIGWTREASVVARRPLGVIALAVVALWPFAARIAQPFLPRMDNATFEAGLAAYRAAENVLTAVFLVNLLVSLAAALIAVVQIARAGVVPPPWRWAPSWALMVSVAAGVLPQMLFASIASADAQAYVAFATIIGLIGFLAPTLGLGVLALVLAARVPERTVEVYRST
ncbi:hypothetical protein [Microbacterium hominis]|uniref:Uncharacterized protein n=1 Tax=Microbacterium hominis TaxID=162426 RepID=A0A7D4Q6B4_9MICO|nr:hypothetical protein [Microbacterium hominis]QKJ18019.1 hypothetical protein HQM25_00350 [Microbacterium hominis]